MAQDYINHLQALLATGLTQAALAQRLGVTQAALNRWLHGLAVPYPRRQAQIAALYKMAVGFQPLAAVERRQVLARAKALCVPGIWRLIRNDIRLQDALLLEHTYNSNAIEGSTLTKRETETVIFDRAHLADKSLIEHLEATNHATVLRDILLQKYPTQVTEALIRQLHKALMQGIREDAGEYAKHPRAIRGSTIALTHPKDIPEEMRGLLRDWARTAKRSYGIADVARFHAAFELIHPFGDGNGRVGRLVMCLQLLARDYPPVVIEHARKADYYDALEHAQRSSADALTLFLTDELDHTARLLRRYRMRKRGRHAQ